MPSRTKDEWKAKWRKLDKEHQSCKMCIGSLKDELKESEKATARWMDAWKGQCKKNKALTAQLEAHNENG